MITPTYAAILADLFLVLSIRMIRLRPASGEAAGSSGSVPLVKPVSSGKDDA